MTMPGFRGVDKRRHDDLAWDRVRLSVVIPAYNEIRSVETLLRRVREVRLDIEVIVVDDGSTDGTRDLLSRLADEGVRVEPDTIFRLASVTKVLTATLVMQNVEMGRLSLDTPVAEYIPEFGKNGKEAVSPRHLLSHSSGMSDKIDGPRPTSFAELLERVYERPLEFEPGTRSNMQLV